MSRFVGTALLLCVLAAAPHCATANAFRRGSGSLVAQDHLSYEDVRGAMLAELMGALGDGSRITADRVGSIEQAVNATFLAMPKNAYGNLDATAVRYVLHRLFVQRHGMFVKGLEPGSESWKASSSSATDVLANRVPGLVLSLFEERLSGRGLGLHEVSMLAATLEHLIHDEAGSRLTKSYEALGLSPTARVTDAEAEQVIDVYMMHFISALNGVEIKKGLAKAQEVIATYYPGWYDARKFAHNVRRELTAERATDPAFTAGQLSFEGTSQVVEQIGERFGRWQDSECRDLKSTLMKLEFQSSGRVLLKDFYNNALGGAWQFLESAEYLRELGALDESDPASPRVIIANYVNSQSNCLTSSDIYQICCINECESMMQAVEQQVAAPEASVGRISEVVAGLASSTVPAPGSLPRDLTQRLEEIARHHGGQVPLHGRLFAQWMHHVYPRECPFPHKAGTTSPMTPDAWMSERGRNTTAATIEEMNAIVNVSEASTGIAALGASQAASLPWMPEEELVVPEASFPRQTWGRPSALAFVGAALVAASAMANTGHPLAASLRLGGLSSMSGGNKPLLLPYAKQHSA